MPLTLTTFSNAERMDGITINPKRTNGQPAKVDGVPVWTVQTGTVTVEASADGLTGAVVSGDNPEDYSVLVTADADLGAGVTEISDLISGTITGEMATNLGLTAGTVRAK